MNSSCQVSISVIPYSKLYKIQRMIVFGKPSFRWKKIVYEDCMYSFGTLLIL